MNQIGAVSLALSLEQIFHIDHYANKCQIKGYGVRQSGVGYVLSY